MHARSNTEGAGALTSNGKRGQAPQVLEELNGQACHSCGTRRYYLVLRMSARDEGAMLVARCSRCHGAREVLSEELLANDIEQTTRQWVVPNQSGPWKEVVSPLS